MRFLFINPNRRIARSNIWSLVNSVTPPLGLAILCAVLDANGHESGIIDAYAENLQTEDILSAIRPETDVVGITATTPEIESAAIIAKSIRKRFPDKKIIMGGVHPTVFHQNLVEEDICDMVVRGEGEQAILLIAEKTQMQDIPNLTWKSADGKVIVNPQKAVYVHLDDLPMPSYNKLPMRRYRSAIGAAKRSPSVGMITSRGCPGKCTFCYSGMFGEKIRYLSVENIYQQIIYLQTNYGIREISFYDDTFTANLRRVEKLCQLIISNHIDISWSCFARVDTVNPGILQLMKAAGCHQIMYGFETTDEKILKAVNKRVQLNQYENVISWTREAQIDIRGAFMLGSPEETQASMEATIAYAKKIDIQYAIFNITTPFPGTELFNWAVQTGTLRHKRWAEYDLSHVILSLPSVSPQKVQDYYKKAYREFYFRWSYILPRLLNIRTVDDLMVYFTAAKGFIFNVLKSK
jgi:anaerobic magnesium-protoporphyrin IX monomethyl ester cyclase